MPPRCLVLVDMEQGKVKNCTRQKIAKTGNGLSHVLNEVLLSGFNVHQTQKNCHSFFFTRKHEILNNLPHKRYIVVELP